MCFPLFNSSASRSPLFPDIAFQIAALANDSNTHGHNVRHRRNKRCQWHEQRSEGAGMSCPTCISSLIILSTKPHNHRLVYGYHDTHMSAIIGRVFQDESIPARRRLPLKYRQLQDHRVHSARSVTGDLTPRTPPSLTSAIEGEQFANAYFDTDIKIKMLVFPSAWRANSMMISC